MMFMHLCVGLGLQTSRILRSHRGSKNVKRMFFVEARDNHDACGLQVAHNSISSLPDGITRLRQLSFLALGHNNLDALPESLSSTPCIMILHFEFFRSSLKRKKFSKEKKVFSLENFGTQIEQGRTDLD
jgi:hypothetical protein